MRIPASNEVQTELRQLQRDCGNITVVLIVNSVAPVAEPPSTGNAFADRSLWRDYHVALLKQLATHSIAYPS